VFLHLPDAETEAEPLLRLAPMLQHLFVGQPREGAEPHAEAPQSSFLLVDLSQLCDQQQGREEVNAEGSCREFGKGPPQTDCGFTVRPGRPSWGGREEKISKHPKHRFLVINY
jgi:hypothetical protein